MKTSIQSKHPSVLIADNDRSTILLLRSLLQKEGYRVLSASNGKECLEIYEREKPDIVLMDAIMPLIDGFTCCQKIKAINTNNYNKTPIILITGLDERKLVDKAFQVEATDYINKPIHFSILRQRLRRILKAKWSEEALRKSENKYRFLVNNLKEVIFQIDARGNLIFLNPVWSEITGFSVKESLNTPLSNFIYPEDDWLYQQNFQSLIEQQEQSIFFQARYLKKNGELGWIEIYAYPVSFNNQFPPKIYGTINDITERKHQEIYQKIENSITRILTDSVSVSEALAKIILVFCLNLDWDLGEFWQVDPETKLLSCRASWNQFLDLLPDYDEIQSPNNHHYKINLLNKVLAKGHFIVDKGLTNKNNQTRQNSASIIDFQTIFMFPLINGEEKLGVITLLSQKVKQVKSILQIVTTISNQICQFIKRKQAEEELKRQHIILQSELNQASKYVRSLLPSPLTDKVEIEQYFLPSIQLGGDIFDYYWLDKKNLVIYLVDVAGHGVRPALLSVSIHNMLRSQSLYNTNFYEPWTVLTELNRVFQMDEKGNDYFTIWYGVYNIEDRELTYACAAHPPAILLTSNSGIVTVKTLSTENIAIGMLPKFDFEQEFVQIEPDSTLYIFSDGVYDIVQADGKIWGFDAFLDTVGKYHQNCNTNLEQIVNHIRQINSNTSLDDDFSLIQLTFK
ncbi:MAG: SpoIIE family protein phosphatase [Xenococcaceae cyanobacterium MO_188.B32]|nr:SpoIIE family protein phosphatase [Xenococcaceae cyanobacterium MO_188.B32]